MAIIQDLVSKELDDMKSNRSWLEKGFNAIKHFVSPKSKIVDQERDENEATYRAQQKMEEMDLLTDVTSVANAYKAEQKDIMDMELKLTQLPEFSDDYYNTKKFLADKKTSFESKQAEYYEKIGKYNNVRTEMDIIKIARGPISSNFVSKDNAEKFIQSVITTPSPTSEDAEVINKVEVASLASLLKNTNPLVNSLIREGEISTPDEYYNSPEFINVAKGAIAAVSKSLGDIPSSYVKEGGIDGEMLLNSVRNSEDAKLQLDAYENFIRKENEKLEGVKLEKTQGLSRVYGKVVQAFDWVSNEGRESFETYNNKDKSFGFFGDNEIKSYLYDATDTYTIERYINNYISSRPQDLGVMIADLYLTMGVGSVTKIPKLASYLAKYDTAVSAISSANKVEKLDKLSSWGYKAIKGLLKTAPRAADEILMSLPINATIDAWVQEYDQLGLNTVFDVATSWFGRGLNISNKILDDVANVGTDAMKKKVLEGYFVKTPEELNVKDTQAVKAFVTQQLDAQAKLPQFEMAMQSLKNTVEEVPNKLGISFYDNFFNTILPDVQQKVGLDYNRFYGGAVDTARKAIADVTKSPEEKLDIARASFKEILSSNMTDTLVKKITSMKVNQALEGSIFNATVKVLKEKIGLSETASNKVALDMIMNVGKDNRDVIGSLVGELGDFNKVNAVQSLNENFVKPLLRSRGDIEGVVNAVSKSGAPEATTGVVTEIKRTKDVNKFIQKVSEIGGASLAGYVTEFIDKLPAKQTGNITRGLSKVFDGLVDSNKGLTNTGINEIVESVSKATYSKDFYAPYERLFTDADGLSRTFGESFKAFVERTHKGLIGAEDVGKLHTQYLLEKFLLNPDGLDIYMKEVLDNPLLSDIEKSNLISQLREMDTLIVEPLNDFIRGMMLKNGYTPDGIDNLFSDMEILKVSGIDGSKGRKINVLGKEMDFEKVFLTQLGQFRSNYKKALATGVGSKGSSLYVPPIRDVVYGIKNAIETGRDFDIPASYLTSDGIRILDAVFQENLGMKGYEELINKAYSKTQSRLHIAGDLLVRYFYDSKAGILKHSAIIDGKEVYLFDLMKNIDIRLSEKSLGNSGGIAFSNSLTMTKSQLLSDKEGFNILWKDFLNTYVPTHYSDNAIRLNDMRLFMDRLGTTDAVDGYMRLINDVSERIKTLTKMSNAEVADVIHPMYYSFDEFFRGVAKGNKDMNVVDSVVYSLINTQMKNGNIQVDKATYALNKIGDLQGGFVRVSKGHQAKNYLISQLSNSYEKFMQLTGVDIPINKADFDSFLYKNIGYFLLKPDVRTTNDVLDIFGKNIIDSMSSGVDKKLITEANLLLDKMLFASKSGKVDEIEILAEELSKVIKKGSGETALVETYKGFLSQFDKRGAREFMMPDVSKFIKNFQPKVNIDYTPSEIIDNALSMAENRELYNTNFLQAQQVAKANIIRQQIGDMIINNADINKSISDVLSTLGVAKKEAREILTRSGYTDDIIDTIFSGIKKGGDVTKSVEVLAKMIEKGDVSGFYLLKNKSFQKIVNKVQADYLNKWSVDALRKTKGMSKVSAEFIGWEGNVLTRVNETYGKVLDGFFNATLSLNARSLYDVELSGIRESYIKKMQKGTVIKPSLMYKGKKVDKLHINSYLGNVKDTLSELQIKNKYTLTELKDMANQAFKENVLATEKAGLDKRMDELYEFFSSYKKDISSYRKEFSVIGDKPSSELKQYGNWIEDISMITGDGVKSIDDFYHRLTGMWVNLSNDDISRIVRKAGFDDSANSKIKNAVIGGFKKDILYGGLYDKNALDSAANLTTQAYVALQYNVVTNSGKGIQQLVNNIVHANARANTFGDSFTDIEKLSRLATTKKILGFDLMGGRQADIAMGKTKNLGHTILQWTSGLYWADELTMGKALDASMMQALAPIYDVTGEKGIKLITDKISSFDNFLKEYDITVDMFTNKGQTTRYLLNKAEELGMSSSDLIKTYNNQYRTFFAELEPVYARMRSAIGAFYMTDNVREFGSIRLVDQGVNRFFFALKKWAIGKTSEYAYRLANDFKKLGVKGILESPTMNAVGYEFAKFIRMGWLAQKATGGDFEAQDFMYQMAVPAVVLQMTFLDAITRGAGQGWRTYTATDDPLLGTLTGTADIINNLFGTAFIYQNWLIDKLQASLGTASQYDDAMEGIAAGWATFARGIIIENLYGKSVSKYRGALFDSVYEGNHVANGIQWITNTTSTKQQDYNVLVDKLFLSKRISNGSMYPQILSSLINKNPIGKLFANVKDISDPSSRSKDVNFSILANSLDEFSEENELWLLNTKYISGHGGYDAMTRLVDKFEDIRSLDRLASKKGEKGKEYVEKIKRGEVSLDEIQKEFASAGVMPELAFWNYVENSLKFSSGFGEEIYDMNKPQVSTEKTEELGRAFQDFVIAKKIDISSDSNALLKFINAQTQLGSNYVMSDYMNAYSNGIWKLIQKKNNIEDIYGGFESGTADIEEFYKGAQTDERYLASVAEYKEVLKRELYTLRPEIIGENDYIGIDLKRRFLEGSIETPVNVSDSLLDYVMMKDINDQLRDDGNITDESMSKFNFLYGQTVKSLQYAKGTTKDKERAVRNVLNVANSMLEVIDNTDSSNAEKTSARLGLSYAFSPLTNYITDANKTLFDSITKNLKPELEMFVDGMTGSSPTDIKTALENATGKNFSGGTGGSGKKVALTGNKSGKGNAQKIALSLNAIAGLGTKMPGFKFFSTGTNSFPKLVIGGAKHHKLTQVDFDMEGFNITLPKLGGKQIVATGGTGETKRLKVTKKSSSGVKSKKTGVKKIRSSKSFSI